MMLFRNVKVGDVVIVSRQWSNHSRTTTVSRVTPKFLWTGDGMKWLRESGLPSAKDVRELARPQYDSDTNPNEFAEAYLRVRGAFGGQSFDTFGKWERAYSIQTYRDLFDVLRRDPKYPGDE